MDSGRLEAPLKELVLLTVFVFIFMLSLSTATTTTGDVSSFIDWLAADRIIGEDPPSMPMEQSAEHDASSPPVTAPGTVGFLKRALPLR